MRKVACTRNFMNDSGYAGRSATSYSASSRWSTKCATHAAKMLHLIACTVHVQYGEMLCHLREFELKNFAIIFMHKLIRYFKLKTQTKLKCSKSLIIQWFNYTFAQFLKSKLKLIHYELWPDWHTIESKTNALKINLSVSGLKRRQIFSICPSYSTLVKRTSQTSERCSCTSDLSFRVMYPYIFNEILNSYEYTRTLYCIIMKIWSLDQWCD